VPGTAENVARKTIAVVVFKPTESDENQSDGRAIFFL